MESATTDSESPPIVIGEHMQGFDAAIRDIRRGRPERHWKRKPAEWRAGYAEAFRLKRRIESVNPDCQYGEFRPKPR